MREERIDECVGAEGLSYTPRVPLCGSASQSMGLFDSSTRATGGSGGKNGAEGEWSELNWNAQLMLKTTWQKPLRKMKLYQACGFSDYMGNKCMKELVDADLVYVVKAPKNRAGRSPELLEVTPKGRRYLKEKMGVAESERSRGKGGVLHWHFQTELKGWYEKHGYTVQVEAMVGEVCLDLLVVCPDRTRLGVQVMVSTMAYEAGGAVKVLGAGLEKLLFIVETEEAMKVLRRRIENVVVGELRSRIGYKLVTEYI